MIELYTFATANGQRASVMLELSGLPYRAHKVDIRPILPFVRFAGEAGRRALSVTIERLRIATLELDEEPAP